MKETGNDYWNKDYPGPDIEKAIRSMLVIRDEMESAWNASSKRKVSAVDRSWVTMQMQGVIRGVVRSIPQDLNDAIVAIGTPLERLEFMRDQTIRFCESDQAKEGYIGTLGNWIRGANKSGDYMPGWLQDESHWESHDLQSKGNPGGSIRDELMGGGDA